MSDIILATINAKWIHPSLALRLLKANLGEYEDRAEILEFALRQPLAEKIRPILAAAPRILAFSVAIWNHRATVELLRNIREEFIKEELGDGVALHGTRGRGAIRPVIVLGGPEVAYLPAESEIMRYADWVVRGEGEAVFRELCGLLLGKSQGEGVERRYRDLKDGDLTGVIQALPSVQKVCGKFIDPQRVDITSIDPGYRLYTSEDLSRKLTYIEASRGCPFGCEFCLSSREIGAQRTGDQVVREFPLGSFLGEMEKLIGRGARSFKFLDRTFNLDMKRARRIMEFFLDHLKPGLYVHFEMVPSRFPPELRELLRRFPAGSLRLEVGIQTFNPRTAALIGRPSDPERELEVIGFLRKETNAIIHADLIAGLPGEDLASFAQGFDRLWRIRPTEIQLGILKCLPGTPIIRHSETFGMRYALEPPYEVLETAALSVRDLDRIKNFARFWELIVNRGAFADLGPVFFPEREAVFARFMNLSDWLLQRFGRNWGIDRKELRAALVQYGG
ncbi:MAG: DUF4080 domain-containing protein [Treponema sp.]|nr:DUF4080 domain-containing protein [Treponema sp.]